MTARDWTDRDLTEYLLGGLPADIRANLEQDYLADPALFERLEVVEDDLVDRYVAGRLRLRTRWRFQRHYLASPPHQAKVSFARRLMQALAPEPVAIPGSRVRLFLTVSYAAMLMLAVALSAWFALQSRKQADALRAMQSRQPQAERPSAQTAVTVPAFVLYPQTFRALEEERRIEVPRAAETVELRPLVAGDASPSYSVTLTRLNGAQVTGAVGKREDRVVRVTLPAASLRNGTYLLRLQSLDSGFQETYQFSVITPTF
jgi:hypothetical protein